MANETRFQKNESMNATLSRRECLAGWAAGAAWAALGAAPRDRSAGLAQLRDRAFFETRGVVLTPDDLTLEDWPQRAKEAGLNTIGLHHGQSPRAVADFVRSAKGAAFVAQCRQSGLRLEYELHAMRELLPRDLFGKNPSLFRMNEKGERTPDANLCVHSGEAMRIAAENALALARLLQPATGRHFFWGDDGRPWCRCPRCVPFDDSDQALILENRILKELRRGSPKAQLAHLAYSNTLSAPRQIKPDGGIFLEFAPIDRRYDLPLGAKEDPAHARLVQALEANLKVFGSRQAQVLEYWLDVSRFSHWRKPAVALPFDDKVFTADLDFYGARGIRHVTTFAVYIDADYVQRYGEPLEVKRYGSQLIKWRPGSKGSRRF